MTNDELGKLIDASVASARTATYNAYDSREAVAYHEAGHVVAAHVLGLGVRSVTIESDELDPGGAILGSTTFDPDTGCSLRLLREISPQNLSAVQRQLACVHLVQLAAGPRSQRRYHAELAASQQVGPVVDPDGNGCSDDDFDMYALVDSLAGDVDGGLMLAICNVADHLADSVLAFGWPKVHAVARALLASGHLTRTVLSDLLYDQPRATSKEP